VPRAVINRGGTLSTKGGVLSVAGADEVLLLIAAATSYRRFDDVGGDPVAINRAILAKASAKPGRPCWPRIRPTTAACSAAWTSTSEPPRRR
jgi:hypothetical protein